MLGFFAHPAWPYLVKGQEGTVSSLAWFDLSKLGKDFVAFDGDRKCLSSSSKVCLDQPCKPRPVGKVGQ